MIGDKSFEVKSMEWGDPSNPNEGEAIIHLGGEYEGCWLSVGYENGLKNGKGVLYRSNHLIMLEVWYVRGICEGEMMERDDNGEMKLKYEMKNGVKSGYEYGYEGGEVVRIELFEEGELKWKSVMNTEMIGYWSVYGSKDELLCVCERSDDLKVKSGICYEYEGSELRRKCVYENDELKGILCEWKSNRMVMYREDGSRLYEGGYAYYTDGYVRDGYGKEYECDGNSVVYSGHWKNSKKNGYGSWYKNGVLRYNGEWRDNEPNGEGSLYDENGRLLCNGEWYNGILKGGKKINYRDYLTDNKEVVIKIDCTDIKSRCKMNGILCIMVEYLYGAFIAFMYDYYVFSEDYPFLCIILYFLFSLPFLFFRRCWKYPFLPAMGYIFSIAAFIPVMREYFSYFCIFFIVSSVLYFPLLSFNCCFSSMCIMYATEVVSILFSIAFYNTERDDPFNMYMYSMTLGVFSASCLSFVIMKWILSQSSKCSFSVLPFILVYATAFSIIQIFYYSGYSIILYVVTVIYVIIRIVVCCKEK